MIVYKLTNKITNKIYIGITEKTLEERMERHKSRFNSNDNYKLYSAWRKYGWDSFEVEIISTANSKDELLKLEQYYIKKYNSYYNGYNSTFGGEDNPMYRVDIKQKHLHSMRTEENRERVSEFFKNFKDNYPQSELRRRESISKAMIGENNHRYGITPVNAKRVGMYDLNDNLLKEFNTANEAIQYLGKPPKHQGNICACCRGVRNTAYGFKWKYI